MLHKRQNVNLVSVVIPAYNREKFIKSAIQSVLSQTFQNFEIIVIDDGSVDNTFKIVSLLAERDNRIRCIQHETNNGAQVARKKGVDLANGEFIAFLDSDDEWYADKLQKQVEAFGILPSSVGVVHCGCHQYIKVLGEKKLLVIPKLSGSIYKKVLKKFGPLYPCLMVRRECFKHITNAIDPGVPSFQEWDLSINLAKKYDFYFIDEPLMVYNVHEDESISKDIHREVEGYLYIVEKHKNEILKYCGKRALGRHYHWLAKRYSTMLKDDVCSRIFYNKARKNGINDFYTYVSSFSPKLSSNLRQLRKKLKTFLQYD